MTVQKFLQNKKALFNNQLSLILQEIVNSQIFLQNENKQRDVRYSAKHFDFVKLSFSDVTKLRNKFYGVKRIKPISADKGNKVYSIR